MASVVIYWMLPLSCFYPQGPGWGRADTVPQVRSCLFPSLLMQAKITGAARVPAHYPDDDPGALHFLTTSVAPRLRLL